MLKFIVLYVQLTSLSLSSVSAWFDSWVGARSGEVIFGGWICLFITASLFIVIEHSHILLLRKWMTLPCRSATRIEVPLRPWPSQPSSLLPMGLCRLCAFISISSPSLPFAFPPSSCIVVSWTHSLWLWTVLRSAWESLLPSWHSWKRHSDLHEWQALLLWWNLRWWRSRDHPSSGSRSSSSPWKRTLHPTLQSYL